MTRDTMNIYSRKQMTDAELADVKELSAICNQYEGLDLKLNNEMLAKREGEHPEDFLCYLDGKLVGFLAVFCFHSAEAEVSGMVHPDYRRQGVFSSLANQALASCKERGIPKILFICEEKSASGKAFVESLGTTYSFSEYVMALTGEGEAHPLHPLSLVEATMDDMETIVRLNIEGFKLDESSSLDMTERQTGDSKRKTYIAILQDEKIGKISVLDEGENSAYIFGFVVAPQHQGKGYGRQIMMETVKRLKAERFTTIGLEVAVENKNALKLYQSCGFEVTTAMDYYSLPLN